MVLPAVADIEPGSGTGSGAGGFVAVIGCGNLARRDDGIGPQVIANLKRRGLEGPRARLLDAGTDGMAVMFAARGASTLILVDAARGGVEPGSVYEVPGAELERPYVPGLNLHDFGWQAALHAGRKIYGDSFPASVTVFLVGAAELGFGVGLSEAAAEGAGRAADRIAARIGGMPTQVSA